MKIAPYGQWFSPISAAHVAASNIRLSQPRLYGDLLFWVETRPAENARNVLIVQCGDDCRDVNPAPYSIGSKAHEYGGGDYTSDGRRIWFVNREDQAIYRVDLGGVPEPVTHPDARRFADLQWDARRRRLVAVCEDHTQAGEAKTTLVAIDETRGEITVLAEGADFYSNPTVSPDGRHLAWLCWRHPNMPWDETELWIGTFGRHGEFLDTRRLGAKGESIFQPQWSQHSELFFVSDRSGWWNLYRFREICEAVTDEQAEFGRPQWVFGMSTYGFLDQDRIACTYTRAGHWLVGILDIETKRLHELDLPFTSVDHIAAAGERVVILAGAPAQTPAIIEVAENDGDYKILRSNEDVPDAGYLSIPSEIEFPTGNDEMAYGFYYAPRNADYAAPEGEKAPLLVKCHGGPTSATDTSLNLQIQYWTSRGFAVLDVNYRGSTGYGRSYRRALYGHWGVADVEDCINGFKFLTTGGHIDPERAAISGKSAGGYVALCALTFHNAFKAGASYYGIGDVKTILDETHKFESRYGDQLIGPYPEFAAAYVERSPLHYADHLSCPVIFFQGLKDKVVPPNQAQKMVDALRDKGLAVAYVQFDDEAHGFRRAENIQYALEAELYFYSRVFGFSPADDLSPVTIDNL